MGKSSLKTTLHCLVYPKGKHARDGSKRSLTCGFNLRVLLKVMNVSFRCGNNRRLRETVCENRSRGTAPARIAGESKTWRV
ncbi:MAG: hypothetical protein LBV17_01015 [Treponema sp.]|nr:hypothetical protein [Treponema sp.]